MPGTAQLRAMGHDPVRINVSQEAGKADVGLHGAGPLCPPGNTRARGAGTSEPLTQRTQELLDCPLRPHLEPWRADGPQRSVARLRLPPRVNHRAAGAADNLQGRGVDN